MLIDTHAHLNDPDLLPLAGEIAAARADRGPDVIVNVGYDVPSSFTAVELARRYAGFYAVVGIHPHDSKSATASDYRALSELASDPKVRAYGEIGLDYHYDLSAERAGNAAQGIRGTTGTCRQSQTSRRSPYKGSARRRAEDTQGKQTLRQSRRYSALLFGQ